MLTSKGVQSTTDAACRLVSKAPDNTWSWSITGILVLLALIGSPAVLSDASQARHGGSVLPDNGWHNPHATARPALALFSPMLVKGRFERPIWASFDHIGPTTRKPAARTRFVIMLDAGHGGKDTGATAANGLLEKFVTLDIARRTALFLEEIPGIDVQMTRTEDAGLSRHRRVRQIRDAKPDLVISLHFNHLPQANINLVEAYYADAADVTDALVKQVQASGHVVGNNARHHSKHSGPLPSILQFTENSQRLASIIQKHVYREVKAASPKTLDAGTKNDMLYVLTQSLAPATLIEFSCISHSEEASRLTNPDYRNSLAAALTDGIREYLEASDQLPGSVVHLDDQRRAIHHDLGA